MKLTSHLLTPLFIMLLLFFSKHSEAQTLNESLKQLSEKHELFGGNVVLFDKDRITGQVNFGKLRISDDKPVDNESLFRVASISKTVTAIAIMQLVEKNKLDLDANVAKLMSVDFYNPEFQEDIITPRMLLSHTSSLNDDPESYDNFLNETYKQNPVPPLKELLSVKGKYYSKNLFLPKKPGSYFNYSNLNYGILGTLVEIVSGMRFDDYCLKFILSPMGINGNFNVNQLSDISKLATLYRKKEGEWVAQTDDFNGKRPELGNLETYVTGTNAIRFGPQGGLRISAADLSKIFTLFLNNGRYRNQQIISAASIKKMMTAQWAYNGSNGDSGNGLFRKWGLGLQLITGTKDNDEIFTGKQFLIGHSGDAYGLVADAFVDTLSKKGFVFITNGSGTGFQASDCSSFYDVEKEVFDLIDAERKRTKIAIKTPRPVVSGKRN